MTRALNNSLFIVMHKSMVYSKHLDTATLDGGYVDFMRETQLELIISEDVSVEFRIYLSDLEIQIPATH